MKGGWREREREREREIGIIWGTDNRTIEALS
jgi:hypothetical protein